MLRLGQTPTGAFHFISALPPTCFHTLTLVLFSKCACDAPDYVCRGKEMRCYPGPNKTRYVYEAQASCVAQDSVNEFEVLPSAFANSCTLLLILYFFCTERRRVRGSLLGCAGVQRHRGQQPVVQVHAHPRSLHSPRKFTRHIFRIFYIVLSLIFYSKLQIVQTNTHVQRYRRRKRTNNRTSEAVIVLVPVAISVTLIGMFAIAYHVISLPAVV